MEAVLPVRSGVNEPGIGHRIDWPEGLLTVTEEKMRQDLNLTELLVDPENPRLESQQGSRDALRSLFRTYPQKMLRLAQEITDRGRLSPLEKIGVSEAPDHPGRYIVREGNRRIAALMVLQNPDLVKGVLPRPSTEKLRMLAAKFKSTSAVDTVECEVLSQGELSGWIALRHTGENDGAGVVPWGAAERARFLERATGEKSIALQFLDQYREYTQGDATSEARAKKVPITTLKRLLDSTAVRERLGISTNEKGIAFSKYPADENHKWLSRVIDDLAARPKKITARTLNKTDQMLTYLDSFSAHEMPNPKRSLREPAPVEPVRSAAQPAPPKRKGGQARLKAWSLRDLKIVPTNARLIDILRELQSLPIEKYSNTHAVMLRVLLELATDLYVSNHHVAVPKDIRGKESSLKARVGAVATHLRREEKLTQAELTATQKTMASDRFFSLATLNQFIHNPHMVPSPSDVTALWKTLGPYLGAVQG